MKPKQSAVLRRRQSIMDMMLSGHTHADLIQHYMLFYPSLTEHSLEKDITWCYDNLKYFVNKNAEDVINRHIMYYDRIIAECVNSPFKGDAIKAMKQKEELLGLKQIANTQLNIQVNTQTNNLDLSHLSLEELKEILKFEETKKIN